MAELNDLYTEAQSQLARIQRLNKAQALQQLKAMDPTVFEHLVAVLFELRGFESTTTTLGADEGIDIHLVRGRETAIVQVKRYEDTVGQPLVRDLYGTMVHSGVDAAYLATTGVFTRQAEDWAVGKPIHLIDGFTLVDWIMRAAPNRYQRPTNIFPTTDAPAIPAYVPPRQYEIREQPPSSDFTATVPAVSETGEENRGGTRLWLWVLAAVAVIVFGFGAGLALTQVANRVGGNTPPVAQEEGTPTPAGDPAVGATQTATPDGTQTTTATPSPTASPTVVASATPCPQGPESRFAALYEQSQLGCATSGVNIVWSAYEPFERGFMLWRSDSNKSYAFYSDGSRWFPIDEKWDGGEIPDRGAPPPGMQAPVRGFGYVWSIRNDIFEALGWATDKEKGFCAAIQTFEDGFILESDLALSCTPDRLYNQALAADWRPIRFVAYSGGLWSGEKPPAGPAGGVQSPENALPAGSRFRPNDHGVFTAAQASGINLDGRVDEWPTGWNPMNTIIRGAGERSGDGDLSGAFQVLWSRDGLYLAARVRDDVHRSGPDGTTMWQGDGLEIHFDRQLDADFSDTGVNEDDYQIGVSFGDSLNQIRAYRWYPYDKEGAFTMAGSVQTTSDGYRVEVLIPWYIWDMDANGGAAPATFGFNVSINDNDGDTPAQQTVVSASPARTTYDDPTEWGTLVLR